LLVCLRDFDYTPCMHRVDRKWTELASGYRDIQSFKTKLAAEFGRAVRVGHNLQFRKELSEWQKKRRVFFALVAIAPFSIIALCITSYYFRDVACVIIYWALLVVIILVTLAVAGRQYIREMVNGKPALPSGETLIVDLEGRWWDRLAPIDQEDEKAGKRKKWDLPALLAHSLPDTYIIKNHSPTDFLLLGPSGIWIFIILDWKGLVVKEAGIWAHSVPARGVPNRGRQETKLVEFGPDDQWLLWKQKIIKRLEAYLHEQASTLELIQGGLVFSNPKVALDKKRIYENTASYGLPKGWAERIRHASQIDEFALEKQLEIIDVLAEPDGILTESAKDEAERLYHQAVKELREYVTKLVK
jgi:hypothetical protein